MRKAAARRRGREDEPLRVGVRSGLVVNGVLHLLVAWLAIRVASGGPARADQRGALQTVAGQPFGRPLLWLVAVGFAAVVLWRAREAVRGHRAVADQGERLRKRLSSAGQAVVYAALTALATKVAAGSPAGSGGQALTARVLGLPGGRVAVVAVGVGGVGRRRGHRLPGLAAGLPRRS